MFEVIWLPCVGYKNMPFTFIFRLAFLAEVNILCGLVLRKCAVVWEFH